MAYSADHPEAKLTFNADSSGKLLTQIEEGYACDVFFSAAQKQMNTLEEDGMLVDGTRRNVVNNQVVVINRKDTERSASRVLRTSEGRSQHRPRGRLGSGRQVYPSRLS